MDEPFIVGGEEMMFPGDPSASGANRYNCRCIIRTVEKDGIEAESRMMRVRDPVTGESVLVEEMTYSEWLQWKRSQESLINDSDSGIIKNIKLPNGTSEIAGITPEVEEKISEAFDVIKSEYNIKLNGYTLESLGRGCENVPFQFVLSNLGGFFEYRVAINADYNFNGSLEAYQARIMRNHNSGVLAATCVEDLIAHEMAHVMTFQDCDRYAVFERVEEEVRYSFIEGMSGYADATRDGAETIAEAFIRYRRGEDIPGDVLALLEKYVLRWKK